MPTATRSAEPHLLPIITNYVVAINSKYCVVWHETRLAAEANEAEGPDADGLPASWWETLILRPRQTGRPCLDKWFSSELALRQQGRGAVAPVCPGAEGWGFCGIGARRTTRWPRWWSSPTERRVFRVYISSWMHACRCLIGTFGGLRGSLKEGRAPGPTAGRSAGP